MTTYAVSGTTPANPATDRTTLFGGRLWLARALWGVVALASFGSYVLLLPLLVRDSAYGDWTIEASARLFGMNIFSAAYPAYALALFAVKYAAVAVFVGVAIYIFWRKSNDWMAILVSMMLLVIPHAFNLAGYTEDWYFYPYPWDRLGQSLSTVFDTLGFVTLFLVLFLFPDGRFVPSWTRWLAGASLLFLLFPWLGENALLQTGWFEAFGWYVVISAVLTLFLVGTWSQVYRYRHVSSAHQQAQTRLVVLGLVASVASITLLFTLGVFLPLLGMPAVMDSALGALVTFFVNGFALTVLPLAFGAAMLRDRLWASDRVLNRAFLYAALSVILLLVYVGVVGALSQIFRSTNNFLIAAVATGVIALLFQPLRARLQQSINRFLYGARQEPFRVLHQLGNRLEQTLTPEEALPLIVETIARTMRVPYAAIVPGASDSASRTEYGSPVTSAALTRFPLRYQNQEVGELVVAARAPNEAFSASDLDLLVTLARQAGSVAYTAHLNAALRQSRERIIIEREQERRRLRRDLHDGLGPTLASQTFKLDAALDLLDPARDQSARAILQDVKAQTQGTVAEIRRIVYELRPPALDDLGLVGALDAYLAQVNHAQGLVITLQVPSELPPLSAAVQVNAYRIVTEGVHNVIKHARAAHCVVGLKVERELVIEITDDGDGFPNDARPGVGLSAMRERAQELGGSFEVDTVQPHGTLIRATLPLG